MLNFVLFDCNPQVLDKLSKMLEAIFIKNRIDAEIGLKTTSATEVLSYLNSHSADVILFDIKLQSDDFSGMELAKKIRMTNKSIYFIFLTGHLEYVFLAFKVKTFDFLPKPITFENLEETILRLISDVKENPKKYIRIDNKNTIIDKDSIYYIRKSGTKLIFQTESNTYEVYSSFNKIQPFLPSNFVRCHKSFIANVDKITNIKESNTILFDDKTSCSIGPKYKNNFLEVFNHENCPKFFKCSKN